MAAESVQGIQVQDTARWVAMARALESERKDAVFHDPLARRLAGNLGEQLHARLSGNIGGTWSIVARTYVIDRLIYDAVREGADAVVNLAAGFDSRPYRLELPASLTWVEVDHADVIAAKDAELQGEVPRCKLERVALDLAQVDERRALLDHLGSRFKRVLLLTEGLLCYLPREAALALVQDLAAPPTVFRWIVDLLNTKVIQSISATSDGAFQGSAKLQFGVDTGPALFEPLGWRFLSAVSLFKTAGRLKRLPFPMSLWRWVPEKPANRPWAGVCVFEPKR